MSHNVSSGCYNYMPAAAQYYVDEAEDYVADYSESDVLSDHHHHQQVQRIPRIHPATRADDVTEIYRRKSGIPPPTQAMAVTDQRYVQAQQNYVPEYYYEPQYPQPAAQMAPPQPVRRVAVTPYSHSMSVMDPRMTQANYYSTNMPHQDAYEAGMYRSTPHLAPTRRVYTESMVANTMQRQAKTKRYPVTVRTPRYYRRGASSSLYKRPSALCLPVASQPDPAVYRRHRKVAGTPAVATLEPQHYVPEHQVYSSGSAELGKTRSATHSVNVHKMDSEGDVDQRISYLEGMLNKFEKDVESDLPEGSSKSDIVRLAKFLKPKLPPSLKVKQSSPKQQQQQQDRPVKLRVYDAADGDASGKVQEDQNSTTLEVQEITGDSLEKLLNQLKKCELVSSRENMKDAACNSRISCDSCKSEQQTEDSKADEIQDNKEDVADENLSYNYQDISHHMLRNQEEIHHGNFQMPSIVQSASRVRRNMSCFASNIGQPRLSGMSQKPAPPSLDDHCALELHRSKSYIVNLIDRALSKELGTIPAEKCDRNQFEHMSTKKAIDMVNRHTCRKLTNNDLCMEITQTLTDSIISTATSPTAVKSDQRPSQVCVCNANEPLYIKQLKQLRWGHLRHIQREVRRLEDLERFLDTCGPQHQPETGTF